MLQNKKPFKQSERKMSMFIKYDVIIITVIKLTTGVNTRSKSITFKLECSTQFEQCICDRIISPVLSLYRCTKYNTTIKWYGKCRNQKHITLSISKSHFVIGFASWWKTRSKTDCSWENIPIPNQNSNYTISWRCLSTNKMLNFLF